MVGVYEAGGWGSRRPSKPPSRSRQQQRARRQLSINVISDGITRLPILEGEISHVEIPRPCGASLGVTIVGGADTPLRCVVVQEVFPDGLAAQDGRLQSGDQIIEVDGVDMTAASHAHVCQELKKFSQSTLRLGVYRERIQAYRPTPQATHQPLHSVYNDDCTSVTLWRERDRPLGLKLGGHRSKPGIFVYEILPDSVAALDGRLRSHDKILAINGHDVRHTRIDMASRLIERSRASITLSVVPSTHTATSPSDGASLCSNNSESFSEHSSNNSSPRIYLPSLGLSSSDCYTTGDIALPSHDAFSNAVAVPASSAGFSAIPSASSPPLSVYPNSDVSSATTDTDDSDSTQSGASAVGPHGMTRSDSPCLQWRSSGDRDDGAASHGLDDRWPPLPEKPKLAQKTAVIKKTRNESLGMRIGGGVASNEGDTPIYIANINGNGPVGRSDKVKKGDVLLSVNGQSLLGLTHTQAVAQLKATAELIVVTLSLLDGPESSPVGSANFVPSWLYWQKLPRPLQISRSVVLQRSPGSSLGFSIVGGNDPSRGSEPIHVLLVVASSPAAVDGKLRCGDRILAVDNYSLEGVSHTTAVGLLKQAGQRVHLEVVSWLGTEL